MKEIIRRLRAAVRGPEVQAVEAGQREREEAEAFALLLGYNARQAYAMEAEEGEEGRA